MTIMIKELHFLSHSYFLSMWLTVFCELDVKVPRKSHYCEVHIQYPPCSFWKVFTQGLKKEKITTTSLSLVFMQICMVCILFA